MRWLKHLFAPSSQRWFPDDRLQRIATAIAAGEQDHTGQICFAVEPALRLRSVLAGQSARERAIGVFSQLRVWDTRANNGVLLYLLLADHRIEVVADRGFDERIDAEQWRKACNLIELKLRSGEPESAIMHGIAELSSLIAGPFPAIAGEARDNELPNEPYRL